MRRLVPRATNCPTERSIASNADTRGGRWLRTFCQILSLALALVVTAGGCSRTRPPRPYQIRFIGPVDLFRTESGDLEPSYEIGRAPSLRFEPIAGADVGCDPFAGGSLDLVISDPNGRPALTRTLPATSTSFERAGRGFVLSPIPPSEAHHPESARAAFRLSDKTGPWHLEVTFHCAGEAAKHTVNRRFWCHRNPLNRPDDDPFWERLAAAEHGLTGDMMKAYARAVVQRPDPADKLWLIRALCQAHKAAGDYRRAEEDAKTWAELADIARFPSEAVLAWNAAHEAARASGDLEKALRYLDRSMAVAQKLDYTIRLPESWYSRAELLDRSGRPLLAIDAARKARQYATANAKRLFAMAADLKELELLQAMGHYRAVNARLIRDYVDTPPALPNLANNVGWLILRSVEAGMPLFADRERALDKADAVFEQALESFQAHGQLADQANTTANLAESAFLRGNLDDAQSLLDQSRRLIPAGETSLRPFLLWLQGEIFRTDKAWDQALNAYQELKHDATATQSAEYAGRAAFGIGSVLRVRGDLDAAIHAFDEALSWIQEDTAIRSPLHSASLLASRAVWEEAAVLTRLDLGHPLEALDVVEQGTWARRQSLARSAHRTHLDPATQERVSRLRHTLDTLDREIVRLEHSPDTPSRAETLRQKESLRKQQWAELEMLIDTGAARTPPHLDEATLKAMASPDRLIVRPVSYPHELVVWTMDSTGLHTRRLPMPHEKLEQACLRFADTCRAGTPDRDLGALLAGQLLGPYRKLPANLVLITEGPLRQLPWTALPWGDKVLIDSTICHHRPTLLSPRGTKFEENKIEPTGRNLTTNALIVADPTRDLPVAAEEGALLARMLPGSILLTQDAATRETVTTRLETTHLFHFAGHAMTRPLSPYLSHLLLAGDGRLSLMEIRALRLSSPLVFLNACGSGQVTADEGGVLGIADGFIAAGASTVIASRWDVPDEVALTVARAFYLRYLDPDGPRSAAAALVDTLRDLRNASPSSPEGVANRGGSGSSRPATSLFFRKAGKPAPRQSYPVSTVSPLDSSGWSVYLVLEGP